MKLPLFVVAAFAAIMPMAQVSAASLRQANKDISVDDSPTVVEEVHGKGMTVVATNSDPIVINTSRHLSWRDHDDGKDPKSKESDVFSAEDLLELLERFRQDSEIMTLIQSFRAASYHTARVAVCKAVQAFPLSVAISELAQETNTTITFIQAFDATVLGFDMQFNMEWAWGEKGQFACADATAYGVSIGLLGAGGAYSVAVSPKALGMGGWDTVGARFDQPMVCIEIGYSPGPFGMAATAVIDPTKISENSAVENIKKAVQAAGGDPSGVTILDRIYGALDPSGMLNFGVEFNAGFDALDVLLVDYFVPHVSVAACDEVLVYCDGEGCDDKLMVNPWADGTLCGLGTTCNNCENAAEYWYSKAMTACGKEPCWNDGTLCGIGTTCNACCNSHEYWYGKAMTACGQESCWNDGTLCGIGTTCNACCNGYEYWESKLMTACGAEPCWEDGSHCGIGTTCNNCCNGHSWWWSKFFTACGH